jgi:hypothetical protein
MGTVGLASIDQSAAKSGNSVEELQCWFAGVLQEVGSMGFAAAQKLPSHRTKHVRID